MDSASVDGREGVVTSFGACVCGDRLQDHFVKAAKRLRSRVPRPATPVSVSRMELGSGVATTFTLSTMTEKLAELRAGSPTEEKAGRVREEVARKEPV